MQVGLINGGLQSVPAASLEVHCASRLQKNRNLGMLEKIKPGSGICQGSIHAS